MDANIDGDLPVGDKKAIMNMIESIERQGMALISNRVAYVDVWDVDVSMKRRRRNVRNQPPSVVGR